MFKAICWLLVAMPIGLVTPGVEGGESLALLQSAKRIVFLGDSITASGGYVAYFDAWLRLQNLDTRPVVIDAGLSSETVSGLSEEGHAGGKFPRPNLHERLDRVLAVTKPDLVIACYGMNCGIYQPLDEGRFALYRRGIERLKEKVEAAGATLILITPPFYDDQVKPLPFSYDDVLGAYAAWLVKMGATKRDEGWRVVDLHQAMKDEVVARRKTDPAFTFQRDGVHPSDAGHWIIARTLIRSFDDDALREDDEVPGLFRTGRLPNSPPVADEKQKAFLDLVKKRMTVLRDAYVAAAGHKRPGVAVGLPIDEAEQKYREYTAELERLKSENSPKH